jgi:hypothetical protein
MKPSKNKKPQEFKGTIVLIKHEWYVKFIIKEQLTFLPVSAGDAWNLDIEKDLEVGLLLKRGLVRLTWKKGNKKYTKINTNLFLEHV